MAKELPPNESHMYYQTNGFTHSYCYRGKDIKEHDDYMRKIKSHFQHKDVATKSRFRGSMFLRYLP